ncbi:MAG: DNA topoisomerase IB [Candidatus Dormibacteria bacterium]
MVTVSQRTVRGGGYGDVVSPVAMPSTEATPASFRAAPGRRRTRPTPPVSVDPAESARNAGLRYVSDESPGIRRQRSGKGWRYLLPDGSRLTDAAEIQRIAHLAIPPAYRDVWICPNPQGHLQATGRDARGRKQYRYHPRWRVVRDETKYGRMIPFGEALSTIRARVERDLGGPELGRSQVLATVVRLLDQTYIRVGNEEYAKENDSFGLTTMENRHVKVSGTTVNFRFRGKSGKKHEVPLRDRRVARIIARCQAIPGHTLFQYCGGDGEYHDVDSADVNEYLQDITGQPFTAKDFRTWGGTVLAVEELQKLEKFTSAAEANRQQVAVVNAVAQRLGNTPAVCRKCYVSPAVLEAHRDGSLLDRLRARAEERTAADLSRLSDHEKAVVAFLSAGSTKAIAAA